MAHFQQMMEVAAVAAVCSFNAYRAVTRTNDKNDKEESLKCGTWTDLAEFIVETFGK
jgi:hypothetical protein